MNGKAMRRNLLIGLALFSALALSACNEDSQTTSSKQAGSHLTETSAQENRGNFLFGESRPYSDFAPQASSNVGATIVDRSKLNGRKIEETHNFGIEVEAGQLQARAMRDYKACLDLGCEPYSSNYRSQEYAYLNARIAPDKLEAFFKEVESGPGKVKEHSVSVQDETSSYVDTEAKLKNQSALRDRLVSLLHGEMVKKVSDVMEIERELTRVQAEIDSLSGQMKSLEKRTSMATVNIRYDVPYYARTDRYENFKTSFARAWNGFMESLDNVVVFLGGALPWIPVLCFSLWLFIKTLRLSFSSGVKWFGCRRKSPPPSPQQS